MKIPVYKVPNLAFYYHPESDAFFVSDDPEAAFSDGMAVELGEQEWAERLAKQIIETRICPAVWYPDPSSQNGPRSVQIDAVLQESTTWPQQPSINGKIFADRYARFPDGHDIKTSAIFEILPGQIYKTKHSTYLILFVEGGKDLYRG